jgi:hypothetical protein
MLGCMLRGSQNSDFISSPSSALHSQVGVKVSQYNLFSISYVLCPALPALRIRKVVVNSQSVRLDKSKELINRDSFAIPPHALW